MRVSTSGKITVYTGATPQGQSHKTMLAQIAADQFGCTPDDITVVTADTAATGLGVGSFAARTAVNAGSSVHLAAIEAAGKVKQFAAAMMEVAEGDIELENGFAKVAGSDVKRSFREVAAKAVGMPGFSMAGGPAPGLEATSHFTPDQSTYSNGTHVAEVEVDIETGEVKVLRYVVMHDCGHVINPMVVEGQVVGGVIHGIGNAFFERMLFDDQRAADLDHLRRLPAAARDRLAQRRGAAHGDAEPAQSARAQRGGRGRHHSGDRDAGVGGRECARAVRRADRRGADHAAADRRAAGARRGAKTSLVGEGEYDAGNQEPCGRASSALANIKGLRAPVAARRASLRAKRSNLASLAYALAAEIASRLRPPRNDSGYSILIFAACTTARHFSVSRATNAAKSAGVPGRGSTARRVSAVCTSIDRTPFLI